MKKGLIVVAVVAACLMLAIPTLAFGAIKTATVSFASVQDIPQIEEITNTEDASLTVTSAIVSDAVNSNLPQKSDPVQNEAVTPNNTTSSTVTGNTNNGASSFRGIGPNCIDTDGNGICDNYDQGYCGNSGCLGLGTGNGSGNGYNNPYAGSNNNSRPSGSYGYVDSNNDGICDNYGTGGGYGHHSGYGHHGGCRR